MSWRRLSGRLVLMKSVGSKLVLRSLRSRARSHQFRKRCVEFCVVQQVHAQEALTFSRAE